jgi:hypothetical protein
MGITYAWAAAECTVHFRGLRIRLERGQAWDASDPLVIERPNLFSVDPPFVCRTGIRGVETAAVESATRAPGEKRGTRRTTPAAE